MTTRRNLSVDCLTAAIVTETGCTQQQASDIAKQITEVPALANQIAPWHQANRKPPAMITRRDISVACLAAAIMAETGCTQQQASDIAKQITAILGKVQAGVVALCSQFGKWVPTVQTVVEVLISIAPAGATWAEITQLIIDDAITTIARACPQAPTASAQATINGKQIDINFY